MKLAKRMADAVASLAVAAVIAHYACHADSDVSRDILIHSSPQTVWKNPMINQIAGELREGNTIVVDQWMIFHPMILACRENQELRWKGHVGMPGIFDGEHRFVLQPQGAGTRLIQSERFSGIMCGRLSRGIIDETAASMKEMNAALKVRAESQTR
jgi:hypothetical protein